MTLLVAPFAVYLGMTGSYCPLDSHTCRLQLGAMRSASCLHMHVICTEKNVNTGTQLW
jgi:hypothetical protein